MNYVQTIDAVILLAQVVLVVIACMARSYPGRPYLIAFTVFNLCNSIFGRVVYRFLFLLSSAQSPNDHQAILPWIVVARLFFYASLVSFGLFLLAVLFRNFSNSALMRNVFSFSGRICRSQFWLLQLVLWPGTALPALTVSGSGWIPGVPTTVHYLIAAPLWLTSLWITFASYSRRWHDIGRSGWMSMISIVPIAGPVVILILLGFRSGDTNANVYGPSVVLRSHG